MNTYEVGSVAACLAPYDWAKAESLLNLLKENNEYNRFLSAAVSRLAATNMTKTKQLFGQFKPDNTFYRHEARLRAAFAIAREKPEEAIELVTGVPEKQYRCLGYLRLATIFSATDKPRAIKMIDSVYDLLDREPGAFRGWLNFGGRAGLAAVAAVRAKEIGYPDLADLVGRTLAMRPSGMEDHWSPGERERNNIRIAAALALVDPASARQVLATVAPPDEFVQRALSQSRDWLFALALADPERALPLTDKLMAKAKTQRGGQNALSQTGLVELCTILTSDNALKELCMYANLPREIRDED